MAVLPKVVYRFRATPMKISAGSSVEIEKLILKFMWRDFLGGPAVSTPHFQCRGQAGSQINWRTKIPQATLHGPKKKKKNHVETQGTRKTKTILKMKNKVGRLTLPDFKTYFETTVP